MTIEDGKIQAGLIRSATIDCSRCRVAVWWRGQLMYVDEMGERDRRWWLASRELQNRLSLEIAQDIEAERNRPLWRVFLDVLARLV